MQRSLILLLLAFFCSTASADENTPLWLRYPAVSPDGSTIVFSSGGQLYRVPAEGGEAIALTGGDSYAFQPQWSPDGKWIAFAADRYGNLDVFIMPSVGGAARRLTSHSVGDYPTGFSADGTSVLFTSRRLGDPTADFYAADLGMHWQLYSVPVEGGREVMVLPTPALEAVEAPTGGLYLYENNPSGEQPWRKHEKSAGTRDIWLYDAASGTHRAVTSFAGHDREPVWTPDGRNFYALSEESGSLNIWSYALFDKRASFQVTFHDKHPVRSPSISNGGDLVYGYDGEIWRLKAGGNAPEKVSIILPRDSLESGPRYETAWYGATEVALSPGGEELAIVLRGEIFVLALDGSATRRITTTPGMERGVSFTADGRCLVYAAERQTWGLYQTCLGDEFEVAFFDATLMEETLLLDSEAEEFQPLLSPDGSAIAYLSDRDEIRLLNLASGETRTLLPAADNYSYADGDIWYAWSPDGRWLAASYAPNAYNPDVALIDVLNGGEPINITPNGYMDLGGVWAPDGLALFWLTDLLGLRRSDSNPGEMDIFAAALTRGAEDRMELSPEAYAREPEADPDAPAEELELDGVERRIFRITPNSSDIIGYDVTADGETVVYVTYDWDADYPSAAVWRLEWRSGTLYQVASDLYLDQTAMTYDRANDLLYLIGSDGIYEVDADGGIYTIYYDAELALDAAAERQAIFDHVWRLTREKFYKPDLHGIDWDFYRDAYRRFLPHIDNSRDFAEMLSEMVGELNASHTGAFFYGGRSDGDETATLGLYYESNFAGPGVKVARVLEGGPADRADSSIEPGVIILAIDGKPIEADDNIHDFLNRKAGVKVRLTLQGADGGESWDEILTPIDYYEEADLAYWDWINQNRALVKELSGGRIGYIHLSAMDEGNYQRAYANIFGRYGNAEALIVDIRFNGGGNLTNQLLTLLTGKQYVTWQPRDRPVGIEPFDRWTKPSIVLMNAAAYSDGSFFPFSYRELGVGKLLGEAVPGTGTAVWWEDQQDPDLVYGIPEAGYGDLQGEYLENQQVEPDIAVALTPEAIAQGRDTQLEAAVEELLKQLP